jgi:hypothetical protein
MGPQSKTFYGRGALDFKAQGQSHRSAVTAPLFNYLAPDQSAEESLVSQTFTSWNRVVGWLRQVEAIRATA